MDDIRWAKPNEGPIFNLNKKLYRQTLSKKFGTLAGKPMVFKTSER